MKARQDSKYSPKKSKLKIYAATRLASLLLMGGAYGVHGNGETLTEENRDVMPSTSRMHSIACESSFVEGEASEPIVHASKKQVEAYKRHEADYEEALIKSLKAHDKLEKAKQKGKDTSKLMKKVQKRDLRVHEIEEKLEKDIEVGAQQALLEKEVEKLDKKSLFQQTKEKVFEVFSSKKKVKSSESGIKFDSQEERDNILTLHGGGFRGILELMKLKVIEEETGLKTFELFKGGIYGTSTGGLAALMLARGMSAGEVLDVYLNNGNRIFSWSYSDYFTNPLGLFRSSYDATQLEAVIQEQVGDATLADVKVPVGVLVQNADTKEGILLSSASHPKVSMLDAGRGTSAATTYFDAKEIKTKDGTFVARDGGFVANDPSEYALIDYRKLNPGKKPNILTLGTGETEAYKPHAKAGLWAFISPGNNIEMSFNDQIVGTRKVMRGHQEVGDIGNYDYFSVKLPTKIDLADITPKSTRLMQALATKFVQTDGGFKSYIARRKQEAMSRPPKIGTEFSTERVNSEVVSQPIAIKVAS